MPEPAPCRPHVIWGGGPTQNVSPGRAHSPPFVREYRKKVPCCRPSRYKRPLRQKNRRLFNFLSPQLGEEPAVANIEGCWLCSFLASEDASLRGAFGVVQCMREHPCNCKTQTTTTSISGRRDRVSFAARRYLCPHCGAMGCRADLVNCSSAKHSTRAASPRHYKTIDPVAEFSPCLFGDGMPRKQRQADRLKLQANANCPTPIGEVPRQHEFLFPPATI